MVAADPTTGYVKSNLVPIAVPLTGLAYGDGELFESYSYGANNYLVVVDPSTGDVKSNLVPIAAPLMGLAYGDGALFESYIYGGIDRLVAVDATTGYARSDLVAIAAPLTGLAYEATTMVPLPRSSILFGGSLVLLGVLGFSIRHRRSS